MHNRHRIWCYRPGERDSARIGDLSRVSKIPTVLAKLLVSRNVGIAEVERYLQPQLLHLYEPNLLPGCARAAMLLLQAVQAKKKFAIYGDYDVDGMTATAILVKALQLEGADVISFIPNRLTDGYGLNPESIRELHEKGVQVLVTVDCGVTANAEVALAKELGMTVIVTDHHQPDAELPKADAIVHPDLFGHPDFQGNSAFQPLPDDVFLQTESAKPAGSNVLLQVRPPSATQPYPFAMLSGASVAFKLAWALCQRFANGVRVGERRQNFIFEAIMLAAVGTIADVVSLTDENRVIVTQGLARLRQAPSMGLEALLKVCGLSDKSLFNTDDVSFYLAPRLNAAGRLEQAWLGVDLLTTEKPENARETAIYLDDLNKKRREMENRMYREAVAQVKTLYPTTDSPAAIVLASHGWHPGVIGIVAGRLAERYSAPTVLIALSKTGNGPGTGSARGIANVPEFNLYDVLSQCSEYLIRFGGHSGAAGLKISEENIAPFRDAFYEAVENTLPLDKRTPQLWIDSEELLMIFTTPTVQALYRLAPFGTDNTAPIFATTNVTLAQAPLPLGKQ